MSIQLLVRFKVKEEMVDSFLEIMNVSKSRIASANGCDGVEVLQGTDDPCVVVLSEQWESMEVHDEYAARMRESGALNKLASFLVEPPEQEILKIK